MLTAILAMILQTFLPTIFQSLFTFILGGPTT